MSLGIVILLPTESARRLPSLPFASDGVSSDIVQKRNYNTKTIKLCESADLLNFFHVFNIQLGFENPFGHWFLL